MITVPSGLQRRIQEASTAKEQQHDATSLCHIACAMSCGRAWVRGSSVSRRYDEEISKAKAESFREGKAAGLAEGREAGLAEGKGQGWEAGRAKGYAEGKAVGREEGFAEGQEAGLAAHTLPEKGPDLEFVKKAIEKAPTWRR